MLLKKRGGGGECQSVFDLGKSWIGGDVGTEASKEELEHR